MHPSSRRCADNRTLVGSLCRECRHRAADTAAGDTTQRAGRCRCRALRRRSSWCTAPLCKRHNAGSRRPRCTWECGSVPPDTIVPSRRKIPIDPPFYSPASHCRWSICPGWSPRRQLARFVSPGQGSSSEQGAQKDKHTAPAPRCTRGVRGERVSWDQRSYFRTIAGFRRGGGSQAMQPG